MSVFILLTISYVIGILLAIEPSGFNALFLMLFLIISGAFTLITKRGMKRLLSASFILFGFIRLSLALYPAADSITPHIGRFCEVTGVVTSVPDNYGNYCSYVLTSESISFKNLEMETDGDIRITSDFIPDTGSRICVRGYIKEHNTPDNSTERDIGIHYLSKGIRYKLHAVETEVIAPKVFLFSPSYWGQYFKSRIKTAIDRYYKADEGALIKSILLGIKSEFTPDFKNTLAKTSAMRFLSPAFMHMFLILSVCQLLGTYASKKKRENILLIFLAVYAMLNSNMSTFIRAALMYSFMLLYRRHRGFSHYPDLAASVILVMLIANPLFIFHGGFVLSAVLGVLIYLFNPMLTKRLRFIKHDTLRNAASLSVISVFGTLPIAAIYFDGIALYTIIFSLFYMPFTLIVLFTAPFVILCCELVGKTFLLGAVLKGALSFMIALPKIVELLPGSSIFLPTPRAADVILYILILYIAYLYLKRRIYQKRFKAALLSFTFLTACTVIYEIADFGNMYVTFVNVGQGDGAVIEVKGKDVILIDGGGSSDYEESYNIGEEVFLPYLYKKGYTKIDLAIVSHYHKDHCQGIIAAIENLDVDTLLLTDTLKESELRDELITAAENNGTKILITESGDTLKFKSGMIIDIFAPFPNHTPKDENDTSVAMKISHNNTTLFFGGDMTAENEKILSGKIGKCDILKVSHHGSDTSSSQIFISELSPKIAVFSVGENNSYSHPHPNVTERFSKIGTKQYRTDTMGDIQIKCSKDGKIRTEWFKEDSYGSKRK